MDEFQSINENFKLEQQNVWPYLIYHILRLKFFIKIYQEQRFLIFFY